MADPDHRTVQMSSLHDHTVRVRQTVSYIYIRHQISYGWSHGMQPSDASVLLRPCTSQVTYLQQSQDAVYPFHREASDDFPNHSHSAGSDPRLGASAVPGKSYPHPLCSLPYSASIHKAWRYWFASRQPDYFW